MESFGRQVRYESSMPCGTGGGKRADIIYYSSMDLGIGDAQKMDVSPAQTITEKYDSLGRIQKAKQPLQQPINVVYKADSPPGEVVYETTHPGPFVYTTETPGVVVYDAALPAQAVHHTTSTDDDQNVSDEISYHNMPPLSTDIPNTIVYDLTVRDKPECDSNVFYEVSCLKTVKPEAPVTVIYETVGTKTGAGKSNKPELPVSSEFIGRAIHSDDTFYYDTADYKRALEKQQRLSGNDDTNVKAQENGQHVEVVDHPPASPTEKVTQTTEEDIPKSGKLDEADCLQIETFYGSHRTKVFVCKCDCKLYACAAENHVVSDSKKPYCVGVPVLLLNLGETRARQERSLTLLLAEKGSGFTLWKTIICSFLNYKTVRQNYHTFSAEDGLLLGMRFSDPTSAAEFAGIVASLAAEINNPDFTGTLKKKKGKKEKKKQLKKAEISQPCCFQHVISLDTKDSNRVKHMLKSDEEDVLERGENDI